MLSLIKKYKFTIIGIGMFVITCFSGNAGYMLLAFIAAIFLFFGEILCNRSLKQIEKVRDEQVKKAEEEAQELLDKYGEQIKNEEQCDTAEKHEHKCNCNGSCGGNCKCHPKKES